MNCKRCGSPHTIKERLPAYKGHTSIEKYVLRCKMCRHVEDQGYTDPYTHKMERNLSRMRSGKENLIRLGKNCGPINRAIRAQEALLSSTKLHKGL